MSRTLHRSPAYPFAVDDTPLLFPSPVPRPQVRAKGKKKPHSTDYAVVTISKIPYIIVLFLPKRGTGRMVQH